MAGNSIGGKKAVETVKERHGPMFYHLIGCIGGSRTGIKKGFACMTPEKRAAAGAKGGRISRRRPIQRPIQTEQE